VFSVDLFLHACGINRLVRVSCAIKWIVRARHTLSKSEFTVRAPAVVTQSELYKYTSTIDKFYSIAKQCNIYNIYSMRPMYFYFLIFSPSAAFFPIAHRQNRQRTSGLRRPLLPTAARWSPPPPSRSPTATLLTVATPRASSTPPLWPCPPACAHAALVPASAAGCW
jgi:hypothetical protein